MKPGTHKIKYVKKAGLWVKTWFEHGDKNPKGVQKQQWAPTKEELEK